MDDVMSMPQRPTPTWRIPVGTLLMLILIGLWAAVIVGQSHRIAHLPILLQAIIYLVAGVIWIFPMRPLVIWMETGRFRGL
jgi:uncharacterized membrane protein YsdA (DUF1294 family)